MRVSLLIYYSIAKRIKERKIVDNMLLDKDNNVRKTYYVKYIPSLLINDKVFYGNWNSSNLFEAVCSSIISKPDICYYMFFQQYDNSQIKSKHYKILIVLIVCIVISIVIFLYCRYRIKKNISENLESSNIGHKISTVVTSYMSLKDTPSMSK